MYTRKKGKLAVIICLTLLLPILMMGCKPSGGSKSKHKPKPDTTHEIEVTVEPTSEEMSNEEIAEFLTSRVVKIEAENDEKWVTGSGFFIDDEGTIVTNYHVIDGMTSIDILLSDGARYEIDTVVDFSPYYDVAVLKADISGNDYLKVADSYQQGTEVFAMGSPRGEEYSFTDGTLSNTSRQIGLMDCVQTNAAINPGNSGGPLVNRRGEVIGINSMSRNNAEGIHYAVKMSMLDELSMDKNFSMNEYHEWYDTEVGRCYVAMGIDYADYTYVHTYTTVTGEKCILSIDDPESDYYEEGYSKAYLFYAYPYTEEGYDAYRDYLREIGYTYVDNIRDLNIEGGIYENTSDGYSIILGIDTVDEYVILTCPIYDLESVLED